MNEALYHFPTVCYFRMFRNFRNSPHTVRNLFGWKMNAIYAILFTSTRVTRAAVCLYIRHRRYTFVQAVTILTTTGQILRFLSTIEGKRSTEANTNLGAQHDP